MILLDTNVVSEALRPAPDPKVMAWLDAQQPSDLWVCAVTQSDMLLGVAMPPAGKRRVALTGAVDSVFAEDFHGRCLPFDATAAIAFAQIVASRTRKDGPISHEDAQIAAVALTHGFSLATRNTRDFIAIEGLVTIDPWR